MFDAFYYQEIHGGTINVIKQIEQDDEEVKSDVAIF